MQEVEDKARSTFRDPIDVLRKKFIEDLNLPPTWKYELQQAGSICSVGTDVLAECEATLAELGETYTSVQTVDDESLPGSCLLRDEGDSTRTLIMNSASQITSENKEGYRPLCGVEMFQVEPGTMQANSRLESGQTLSSADGKVRLVMESNGDLVIYNSASTEVWSKKTGDTGAGAGAYLALESDGSLVLYKADGSPSTWTESIPGAIMLRLGSDCKLAAEDLMGTELWSPSDAGDCKTDEAGTISAGSSLNPGEVLSSADGQGTATMQNDGNLVIKDSEGAIVWSTGTHGHPGARLVVEARDDDALVLVIRAAEDSSELWTSANEGDGKGKFATRMRLDGCNLVAEDGDGAPKWSLGKTCPTDAGA